VESKLEYGRCGFRPDRSTTTEIELSSGLSIRLAVGRPWFDSLVESDQNTLGDRPASSLVVSLGKALNGIASTYEWLGW